jgi:uncharacterized damage-inducible protein DinB
VTWTAPDITRPEGALDTDEGTLLRGLLDFHRSTLLMKCAGLTGEQLGQRSVEESTLSLHGLIRHLAKVERIWFRERLHGEPVERLYSTADHKDADFDLTDPGQAEADYARLVEAMAQSRTASGGLPLDTLLAESGGEPASLRFVFVHMIGEYQRHNGHADILRQRIDGITGA